MLVAMGSTQNGKMMHIPQNILGFFLLHYLNVVINKLFNVQNIPKVMNGFFFFPDENDNHKFNNFIY